MKKTSLLLALVSSSLASNAQTAAEASQSRIQGTQREQPAPVTGQNIGAQEAEGTSPSESDTGAQRPISLKRSGISSFFGYDTKVFYRDNPLSVDNALSEMKTGMWTNTFFGGAGLGVFDMDDAVVTPYIGGSYTINDYLETAVQELELNYNSTNAYALLLAQFSNGWSGRIGVSYAMDKNTESDTEEYSEFFPNIGIMKTYSLPSGTLAVLDAYVGKHTSTSNQNPEDILDNLEIAASYGLIHRQGAFIIKPKYLLSFKSYDKGDIGDNDGREDLTHNLSVKIDYPFADSLTLSLFSGYTIRETSGYDLGGDYENFDGGLGLTLNSRF